MTQKISQPSNPTAIIRVRRHIDAGKAIDKIARPGGTAIGVIPVPID